VDHRELLKRAAWRLLGTIAIPPELYAEFESELARWGGGDVERIAEAFISTHAHEILSTPRFRANHASKVFALAEALEAQLDAEAYPYPVIRDMRVELAVCRNRCAYILAVRRIDRRTEYRSATLRRRGIKPVIAALRGSPDILFDVINIPEPPYYIADVATMRRIPMTYEAPKKHRREVYEAWKELRSRGLLVLVAEPPIDLYVYDGEMLAVTLEHPGRSFMRVVRRLGLIPAVYISGELRRLA